MLAAWALGEVGHRWTSLPRISLYGLVGFLFAPGQLGLLGMDGSNTPMLLANVAFGLILFEFGYRINLRWLRTNPWIAVSALVEALATFAAVTLVAKWWGASMLTSLLLGSLAMSTSPAAVMRVINEERSSGQVTERVLHLAAANCVLAVLTFKVVVGVWTFQSSGSAWSAWSNSAVQIVASTGLGLAFGLAVPALLRQIGNLSRDATVAFALSIVLLVAVAVALKISPVLATLTFGFVARHRRVAFTQAQRNFGALGDVLAVVLFVFVATTIEWQRAVSGIGLGLLVIAVRAATQIGGVAAFAHLSGVSWRKGALTGLALTPISVFVILMLEQARYIGIDLVDQLAVLAATTLVLELLGPVATQRALIWARESNTHGDG